MKERPILFKAEMVQAILDGRKTQTRRVLKADFDEMVEREVGQVWPWCEDCNGDDYWYSCPYGKIGDRLWVRETFCYGSIDEFDAEHPDDRSLYVNQDNESFKNKSIVHKQWCLENNVDIDDVQWKPSIHMPRWASRILLEIISIRVERLNDISEEDAAAEGMIADDDYCAEEYFSMLWNQLNGWDEKGWNANPWVWVVEFRVIEGGAL